MAMRGAIPNTKLKPSSPSQNGAAGNITANCANPITRKLEMNPLQIIRRAFLNPHTSAIQSLMIYEIGKTINPAVAVMPNTWITLVSNRFEATRQILNRMPNSMNGTVTVDVFCIFLVFNEVYQALGE